MKKKLYINFGLPKTSSTNLQKNFYPNIKGVNYLGRTQDKGLEGNSELFKKFNIYVEGGELSEFDKDSLDRLKQDFKKNLKGQINLISMENWAFPFQRNVQNNKIEIVSQFEKLTRLRDFVIGLDVDFSFFVIHRNPVDGIISLFVTAQNRIEKIFGSEYLGFKNFLLKYEKKDNDYKNIELFFDVYNLRKIKEIFSNTDLKIFDYEDIKNNPKKFLNHFLNYLNLSYDDSLLKNIQTKTSVSPLKKGNYFVNSPNSILLLLKKLIPKFIKNRVKFLFSFSFLNKLFLKDNFITKQDTEKLNQILIKENKILKN